MTQTTLEPATGDPKRLATAKARAAMAGVELHAIEDDAGKPLFVCCKWALTASFDNLDDVETWLDRVAGVKR